MRGTSLRLPPLEGQRAYIEGGEGVLLAKVRRHLPLPRAEVGSPAVASEHLSARGARMSSRMGSIHEGRWS